MKWKTMRKLNAEKEVEAFDTTQLLSGKLPDIPAEYGPLREQLHAAWQEAEEAVKDKPEKKKGYLRDIRFGFRLYTLFTEGTYAMTPREASNCDIWRYISVQVVPDIIISRWESQTSWADRFYRKPNRIWLKIMWWYIYLSWQDNLEDTAMVLEGNNSDTISQLVERSGAHGYRPELYRKIIYRNYLYYTAEQGQDKNMFRKIMKLHTARAAVIEPELMSGGISEYVKGLYQYIEQE